MNVDQATVIIHSRLGMESDLEPWIIAEMQLTQTELEGGAELPWFLKSLMTGNFTAGVTAQDLPQGFIRECDEEGLWIQDPNDTTADWNRVVKKDFNELQEFYQNDTGLPKAFALVGEKLYLFPQPDLAYTYKWFVFTEDTKIAANTENNWLKYIPDLLIGKTGERVAMATKNDAMPQFSNQAKEAYGRLVVMNTARAEANRMQYLGG